MKKDNDFAHLHIHSDHSQLDGCGKIADYAQKAKDMGHKAIAFTEHGTMRQYYTQLEECEAKGLKPLYGIEFYVANNMRRKGLTEEEKKEVTSGLKKSEQKAALKNYEEREGIRDRYHLTVLAKNDVGLKNLFRLSTNAWLEGFYYKPRIDIEELIKYKDGLIVATGCQSSVIYDRVCVGRRKKALEIADKLYEEFGDNLRLEVMPHEGEDQIMSNKFAMELYERWERKIGLLATQDAHYVDASDMDAHEVLLCIGTRDNLSNPDRFRFGDGELYLKSRQEMYDSFIKYHKYMGDKLIKASLDNTLEVADCIQDKIINIDRFACLMPPVDVPSKFGGDEYAYTRALCVHGWTWREIPKRAESYAKRNGISYEEAIGRYKHRLKHELGAIQKQKFITYFLLVRDVYNWARKQDIMCGPGRGSAAGSLVAFLLGITSVDPIEHALLFERFINPARVDMPDIDMDFEDVRRQEIIQYLRDKYGDDRVSQIATVGKLSGKQCLKDISRVLEIPYAEVNAITNSIIERSSGDERASQTIEDSFKDFKICREFNKRHPEVLKYAKVLEGMNKNLGIHAAGVVTSPIPLVEITPLEVRKHKDGDVVVTAVDMNGAQAHGLLKLDVLGLRTLAVLKDTLRAVEEKTGEKIDLERLELNDPKVLQAFTDHDYVGVFQYDSPSADKICMGVEFDSFEDVAAMTALNRPGTARSGLATEYVDRKKHPEKRKHGHFHPKVSEITSDTMGVIVYQEHVQKIFVEIAGFPPGTADSLRKKIAKKFGDETIGKERENFIRGAREHSGIDEKTAGKIMDAITFFGSYGFNKCITGCTKLYRAGANQYGGPEITVKELHEAQLSDTPWGDKIRRGKLNVLQMDEDGRIRPGNLKTVYYNGKRDVVKITTADNREISITTNHKLLTDEGYKVANKIRIGDDLVVMGRKEVIRRGHQTDRAKGKTYENTEGKSGAPKGDGNPAWIDGRNIIFKETKKVVRRRSGGNCEECGEPGIPGKGGHEFAHLMSLELCNGDYKRYHSPKNIRYLCNSCHKYLDYYKGERKKRWSKGRPSILDRVTSIQKCDKQDVYDIEMDTQQHNYIANGIVSHNSHATSYGVIAYWGMFLKTYHPLEFYWALLKNTPDRIRIQSFAKDAKRHGIELLPPDVSISGRDFVIDRSRNAIRGSLVDIKNVGEKAANSIMDNQPYADYVDFLSRIDRRAVNRRVLVSLAEAGALEKIIPNTKWYLLNIDKVNKSMNYKHVIKEITRLIRRSADLPDYTVEEKQLIASKVNPLAFGKHPIDAYEDFIRKYVKVPLVSMSDGDFWEDNDGEGVYIIGVVVEVKYNQIGDFHTGELPPEKVRETMFWGRRYANVNVEDAGGSQNRIKFDIDIFDDMRELIDSGIGTPVIVHAIPNKKYENLNANFAIDLETYRKKIVDGGKLNIWERIIAGNHPANVMEWKPTSSLEKEEVALQRRKNDLFFRGKTKKFTGIVVRNRLKYDKNDKLMSFFSLLDANNDFINCICFASNWDSKLSSIIRPGNFLSIELDRKVDIRDSRKWQYFFNGGRIHWYKKIN